MSNPRKSGLLIAMLLLAGVSSARADIIVVNQTLDLTKPKAINGPGFQGWQDTPAFNGGYNVAIAEGDTFEFTIDFLGSQTLTLNNASFVWAFSYSDLSSDVTGTGTFYFLDANGAVLLASDLKTDSEGDVHFGQNYNGSDFAGGIPASITFSGVRYVGTVDDYLENGVTTRNYNVPAFYFTADDAIVGQGTAVPEPASVGMAVSALGLFGFVVRRRKHA